ncbi:Phytosulfokines 5 [Hordeum vulgare]|nr:Phytosulfokines 5 [Hordeum vulgare]
MDGLSLKEKKDVNDNGDSSGDRQNRFDPYCIFDQYLHDKDGKDAGKDKKTWLHLSLRNCLVLVQAKKGSAVVDSLKRFG